MTDKFVTRSVVLGLIFLGAVAMVGGMWLTAMRVSGLDQIWTLAGGALGALGTLLARTSVDRPGGVTQSGDVNVDTERNS